jgi:hypothetical protein
MEPKNRFEEIKRVITLAKGNENELLKIERMWKGKLKTFTVYDIPLSLLVYNKYNGRILSRTKSLEAQKEIIDVSSKEGSEKIARLLWESKESANENTLKDLTKYGQKEIAMITTDGVIIDGNRRTMLLNRIDKFDYLKTIVLPVSSTDDPLEIERLETSFQMGSDEKLSYNPIEKYIKSKTLLEKLTDGIDSISKESAIKKIADWMQEKNKRIIDYLNIMEVMDDYLDYHDYNNLYIQLDGKEDHCIFLNKWIQNLSSGESAKGFDGYTNKDVDDLKCICFDFIRAGYEGKEFRIIAEGHRENHFFGNEDIWRSFHDGWVSIMKNVDYQNPDFTTSNLKYHLESIDKDFENQVLDKFKDLVKDSMYSLERTRHKNAPTKTLRHINNDVNSLNLNNKSLSKSEKHEVITVSKTVVSELMSKVMSVSIVDSLDVIIGSLNKMDVSLNNFTREERLHQRESIEDKLNVIKKTIFDLSKKL